MTALVKNTFESQTLGAGTHAIAAPVAGGFGPMAAPIANDNNLARALVTMLLVLYPAMATAAVVVAALVFSGAQPILHGYGLL